jgi:DNA-binding transcriptional ArsR family regulator
MDEIPEIYNLETVEQMRAIADDLRRRIVVALSHQPMTVTQLGSLLGQSPAKVHYHVRELERVGLVKRVETREKGGILEKYYRSVAKCLNVPGTLLMLMPPDDRIAAANEFLQSVTQGFMRALAYALEKQVFEGEDAPALGIVGGQVWMTNDEVKALVKGVRDLVEMYSVRRGIAGERERTVQVIAYETLPPADQEQRTRAAETPSAAPPTAPSTPPMFPAPRSPSARGPRRRIMAAGATEYTRAELERVVARGEALDITAMGSCHFADDVSAELVERAVARFRCRGEVVASPEVRAALKRKEV